MEMSSWHWQRFCLFWLKNLKHIFIFIQSSLVLKVVTGYLRGSHSLSNWKAQRTKSKALLDVGAWRAPSLSSSTKYKNILEVFAPCMNVYLTEGACSFITQLNFDALGLSYHLFSNQISLWPYFRKSSIFYDA